MSLLQQLSAAALAAQATSEGVTNCDRIAAEAACSEVLNKMTAALAACRESAGRHHAVEPDYVQAVQDGLAAVQQQLEQLIQEQQGTSQPQQQQQQVTSQTCTNSITAGGTSSTSSNRQQPSFQVLQSLLQLAVGDVELPAAAAAAGRRSGTKQQQQQGMASMVPDHHQDLDRDCDLISQPDQLLLFGAPDGLHTAAAAAATPGHRSAARQQQQYLAAAGEALKLFSATELAHLPAVNLAQALLLQPLLLHQILELAAAAVMKPLLPAAAAAVGSGSEAWQLLSGSRSSSSSIHEMLSHHVPCWQDLPRIMASSPVFLKQACSTLSSWCEQSGHQRLWTLTTAICRPAWQILAAAAAAAAPAAPKPDPQQQRLAAAFALLCPDRQQQQLLQVLVQQPTPQGLRQLLLLLEGCCGRGDLGVQGHHTSAAGAQAGSSSCCWPSLDEWQQSFGWQSEVDQGVASSPRCGDGDAVADGALVADGDAVSATSQDLLQVLATWRLVVQHRCWYQYACYMLVHCCCSSTHRCQQQQQPPEGFEDHGVGRAASFIAWVHEPVDSGRRVALQQLLLAPLTTADFTSTVQQGAADTSLNRYGAVTQCWQQAYSSSSSWAVVINHDLAVAMLQQQEFLTSCSAGQMLQTCFPEVVACKDVCRSSASLPDQIDQQQQQQQQTKNLGLRQGVNSDLGSHALKSRVVDLLDALDEVSSAVVQLLQASMQCNAQLGSTALLSQQQQQLHEVILTDLCDHWLAKRWICEIMSNNVTTRSGVSVTGSSVIQVAKQLLVTVTAADREAKAVLSWMTSLQQ